MFSIPLEIAAQIIGLGSNQFTVARMIGAGLILAAFVEHKACFGRIPTAFWYLCLYQLVCAAWVMSQDGIDLAFVLPMLFTRIQLLFLLVIAYNLFLDVEAGKKSLLILLFGCATLGMLLLFGIGSVTDRDDGRMTIEGANANEVGMVLGLGLVALVGYIFGQQGHSVLMRLSLWGSSWVLLIAVVSTGSRGAMLASLAGLLAWGLFSKTRNVQSRLKMFLLAILSVVVLVGVVYSSESARMRWEDSIGKGNTAGRDRIFTASWEMFLDRPVAGWGPVTYGYELGSRTGKYYRGAHNLYLFLLIETGLLGATPIFCAFWLCLRTAWKNRSGAYGVLPFVLLVFMLVANMSGDWLDRKLLWITLAYAMASGQSTLARSSSPPNALA